MKTAIYIRVSTQEQAKRRIFNTSKEKLFKYCRMELASGRNICRRGISGSTIEKRPAAIKMLGCKKKII